MSLGIHVLACWLLFAGMYTWLKRPCRYTTKPPVAEPRLSLTENSKIRYELKTPYNDGTTHIIYEPLDFMARLAALVPKPRVNLTRFHGDYAPNCKLRSVITSGGKKKSVNIKKKSLMTTSQAPVVAPQ